MGAQDLFYLNTTQCALEKRDPPRPDDRRGFFILAIYFTGADKSWLFFLLFIRTADQANTNFRRALAFAHLSVALYGVLLLEKQGHTVHVAAASREAAAALDRDRYDVLLVRGLTTEMAGNRGKRCRDLL